MWFGASDTGVDQLTGHNLRRLSGQHQDGVRILTSLALVNCECVHSFNGWQLRDWYASNPAVAGEDSNALAMFVFADDSNVTIRQIVDVIVDHHHDGSADVPLTFCAISQLAVNGGIPSTHSKLSTSVRTDELKLPSKVQQAFHVFI